MISFNTIEPDPQKIEALKNASRPTDKSEVRTFLGAAGYLGGFVPYFSTLAQPLTRLMKKSAVFEWTKEQQDAYDQIIDSIAEGCQLAMPDPTLHYVIFTDASETGLGAVLCQPVKLGSSELLPLSFLSRTLNECERRWDTMQREVFAIVWALETVDRYIRGSKVIVYSDHKNLSWMSSSNNGKVQRWGLRLQEYSPDIRYIKGEDNCIADWLSRSSPVDNILPEHALVPAWLAFEAADGIDVPTLQDLVDAAGKVNQPEKSDIIWEAGMPLWHRSKKVYVAPALRQHILWWFHASPSGGHLGANKVVKRITKYFGWKGLAKDVEAYVKACILCKIMRRTPKTTGSTTGVLTNKVPMNMLSLDMVGPLRCQNGQVFHVHVAVDHGSRFMIAQLIEVTPPVGPDTGSAIRFVEERVIQYFGVPRVILCDRGSVYASARFTDYVTQILGARLVHTSPYYPQGNGVNESSHRLIDHAMKTNPGFLTDPHGALAAAVLVHNTAPRPGLRGSTPAFALLGFDPTLPQMGDLTPIKDPVVNRLTHQDQQVRRLCAQQLAQTDMDGKGSDFDRIAVGDVAVYPVNGPERLDLQHKSGIQKWAPHWSLPQRVQTIHKGTATVVPLWSLGPPRQVPLTQLRRLPAMVPSNLKSLVPAVLPIPHVAVRGEELTTPGEEVLTAEPPQTGEWIEVPRKRRKYYDPTTVDGPVEGRVDL